MAEAGRVCSKPAKRSFLFTPVRMAQRQPVACRLRVDAFLLDALDKPMSASEQHDRARGKSVRGRVSTDVLVTGAVVRDDLVRKSHIAPVTERRRQPGKVATPLRVLVGQAHPWVSRLLAASRRRAVLDYAPRPVCDELVEV